MNLRALLTDDALWPRTVIAGIVRRMADKTQFKDPMPLGVLVRCTRVAGHLRRLLQTHGALLSCQVKLLYASWLRDGTITQQMLDEAAASEIAGQLQSLQSECVASAGGELR